MRTRRWIILLFCLAWAVAIFLVSGITFSTEAIFAWFHEHVFRDPESYKTFRRLWFEYWGYVSAAIHFLEYAVLMLLCTVSIDALTGRRSRRNLVIAASLCLVYAVSDEWHQAIVPRRSTSVADFLTDALGIGTVGLYLLRGRNKPHKERISE